MTESISSGKWVIKEKEGGVGPIFLKFQESRTVSKKDTLKIIRISSREKEVLQWVHQGKTSWEISIILGLSERTVNFHVYNVMEKLEAVNRPQMVTIALRIGLIDLK